MNVKGTMASAFGSSVHRLVVVDVDGFELDRLSAGVGDVVRDRPVLTRGRVVGRWCRQISGATSAWVGGEVEAWKMLTCSSLTACCSRQQRRRGCHGGAGTTARPAPSGPRWRASRWTRQPGNPGAGTS